MTVITAPALFESYERQYYGTLRKAFDHPNVKPLLERLTASRECLTVLDLGCGPAWTTLKPLLAFVSEIKWANAKIVGVDSSEIRALRIHREALARMDPSIAVEFLGNSTIFEATSVVDIKYKSQVLGFDLVLLFNYLPISRLENVTDQTTRAQMHMLGMFNDISRQYENILTRAATLLAKDGILLVIEALDSIFRRYLFADVRHEIVLDISNDPQLVNEPFNYRIVVSKARTEPAEEIVVIRACSAQSPDS